MGGRTGVAQRDADALATLEELIKARWNQLSAADRRSVGVSSPDAFVRRIWWDLVRVGGDPLLRVRRASVPGGPAAQREARGLRRREYLVDRRSGDSLDLALSYGRQSFGEKQLVAFQ